MESQSRFLAGSKRVASEKHAAKRILVFNDWTGASVRIESPPVTAYPANPDPHDTNRPDPQHAAAHGDAAVRQDRIICTAARVFADRGYRQTDVQVIADEIGVGKGTIYRNFRSKEALFLATVDHMMHRLGESIRAATADVADPLDCIRAAIRAYLAFFDRETAAVELILQERAEFKQRLKPTYFAHQEANIKPWLELFGRLMDDGVVRRMPPEAIATVINNTLYGTIFTNYFAGNGGVTSGDFESQAEQIIDIMFNGILLTSASDRSNDTGDQA